MCILYQHQTMAVFIHEKIVNSPQYIHSEPHVTPDAQLDPGRVVVHAQKTKAKTEEGILFLMNRYIFNKFQKHLPQGCNRCISELDFLSTKTKRTAGTQLILQGKMSVVKH